MLQASCFECLSFDPFSFQQDDLVAAEVDVGWRHVVEAFVVALVVAVGHKCFDAGLEVTRQEVVFQQDAVLERLMPPLDFALGLRVIWCASNMIHGFLIEPLCQIAGDVR